MIRALRGTLALASVALASTLAYPIPPAPVEHVGVNAERGDPRRWYVLADTPQLRYQTQVKEAGAALDEALKDCRALQYGRTDCVAQARALHRRDLDDARALLQLGQVGAAHDR